MFFRMLLIGIFTLLSWQVFYSKQSDLKLKKDLNLVKTSLQDSKQLQSFGISLTQIESYINELKTEQKKSFDTAILNINNKLILYQSYYCITQANKQAQQNKMSEASEKILSCKSNVWKSGDNFPHHQETLRSLMGPIDTLAQQWKNNEKNKSSIEIENKLSSILDRLGK